jgi:hypothetical protein
MYSNRPKPVHPRLRAVLLALALLLDRQVHQKRKLLA